MAGTSRRERLRQETTLEIRRTALDLLTHGGTDALTLRAIAREIGLTPSALYAYFATRDDLLADVIDSIYEDLADHLDRAAATADDGRHPVLVHGLAYREWALEHRAMFALIYGDPVPGYVRPTDGAGRAAEHRMCSALMRHVIRSPQPSGDDQEDLTWEFFEPTFRQAALDLGAHPSDAARALRAWGRMHGLLTLERNGHLGQVDDPGRLYEDEMRELVAALTA